MKKYFIAEFAFACACLASAAAVATGQPAATAAPVPMHVAVGDITDSRSTGQFFKELKVEFKLGGDEVFDAYGIGTPVFSIAQDDTDHSLMKEAKRETMLWTFQPRQKRSESETITATLINPARRANTVTMEGIVPVYIPTRDPGAVVSIANIATLYGKPIEWKDSGITLTVLNKTTADAQEKDRFETSQQEKERGIANPSGIASTALNHMFGSGSLNENSLQFTVNDPQNRMVRLEIVSGDQIINPTSRMQSTTDKQVVTDKQALITVKEDTYVYSYSQPPPADATLRVYFTSQRSLINVPFKFAKVPLP
jgi:hypothetical protein